MSSGEQKDDNMAYPTDIISALMAMLNLPLLMQNIRRFCKLFRIPWVISIFVFWVYLDKNYIKLCIFIPFSL